ncbi:DUF6232 family protein [Gluconobacter japonicus]|uniref:DUF6232 family protein n=1 Tax=Gluconobacter japonicus TaxID=376620 RepID=UPI003D27EF22
MQLYKDKYVSVDRDLIKIGGSSYAVANVAGVRVTQQDKSNAKVCAYVVGVIDLVLFVLVIFFSQAGDAVVIPLAPFLLFSYVLYRLSKWIKRPIYHLWIGTTGSDQVVLTRGELTNLREIQAAIEQAISRSN